MRRLVSLLGAVAVLSSATPAGAQDLGPRSLVLSPGEAEVGERVIVRLESWISPAVTLHVCGNLALRGAEDCGVVGGQGIGLARSGPTLSQLTVSAPPTPCPCVVRASSATNSEVQTAPLAIVGVAVGPLIRPVVNALVVITAEVSKLESGPASTVRTLLGGRMRHQVRITLRNTSSVALPKVSMELAVGRSPHDAQPVPVPAVEPLQPGETRVYDVVATLQAPTWGSYRWEAAVDGAGPRVAAQATSSSSPWLLYLLSALLLADVVAGAVLRVRRRACRGVRATP